MKQVPFIFILLQIFFAGTDSKLAIGLDPRIVGGVKVHHGENPAMVSLVDYRGQKICGASILNRFYVLTAAHCVIYEPKNYKIVTGAIHVEDEVVHSHADEYKISRIHTHPNYESVEHGHDIALLRTSKPIAFIPTAVSSATLARPGEDDCDNATVWGWGQMSANGHSSNDLLKVEVPLVSWRTCALDYDRDGYSIFKKSQLCYGAEYGGRDSCTGDSGGPLTCSHEPYFQIGLVSFGIGCAEALHPGVYTRVSSYYHWVQKTISRDNDLPYPDDANQRNKRGKHDENYAKTLYGCPIIMILFCLLISNIKYMHFI